MQNYFPAASAVAVQPQPDCVVLSTRSQASAARAIRAAATGLYFTTAAKTLVRLSNTTAAKTQPQLDNTGPGS